MSKINRIYPNSKFQAPNSKEIPNSNDRKVKRNTIEIQWKYNRNTVEIRRDIEYTAQSVKVKKHDG